MLFVVDKDLNKVGRISFVNLLSCGEDKRGIQHHMQVNNTLVETLTHVYWCKDHTEHTVSSGLPSGYPVRAEGGEELGGLVRIGRHQLLTISPEVILCLQTQGLHV